MSFDSALRAEFGDRVADRVTTLHNAYGLVTMTQESLERLKEQAAANDWGAGDKLLIAVEVAWAELWEARALRNGYGSRWSTWIGCGGEG